MVVPVLVRLTRAVDFSTSLRYWRADLSESENRALFGRFASQHGHNYRLEVTVQGTPDPVTGMVMDLKDLKAVIEARGQRPLRSPRPESRHVASSRRRRPRRSTSRR